MPDNQAPISRSRPDPVMPQPKSLGGFSKSKFGRAILATPFLFLAVSCFRAMDLDSIRAFLEPRALSGRIEWDGGTIPILQQFHNVRFLDDLWRGTTVAFAPSALGFDAVSWWQMFTFLNDFTVLYSISLVESARRANSVTASQFPVIVFFAAQLLALGFMAPIYHFLHYTFTPSTIFRSSNLRLVDPTFTRTIFPVVLLFSTIPVWLAYLAPEPTTRHYWTWAWQMFPLWVSISQAVLTRTVLQKPSQHDHLQATTQNRNIIRLTVGLFAILSAFTWLYTYSATQDEFVPAMRRCLQYDELFTFASSFLWLGYLFFDLKQADMVKQNWEALLVMSGLSLACFGPGATLAAGWLWREEILAEKVK